MNVFSKHAPVLFIGAGLVGAGVTAYMAFKSAPKVRLVLEDAAADAEEEGKRFGAIDKAIIVGKTMWPVFAVALLSAISVLWGGHVSNGRTVRTMTALAATEKRLSDYQTSTLEEIGEEAERKIRKRMAEKRYSELPEDRPAIIATGRDDEQLFFDMVSGREFYATMNQVDSAINCVNERLLDSEFVSLNDFYDEIDSPNLPRVESHLGDYNGWDYHIDGKLSVDKFPKIDEKGRAVICIDYKTYPHYRH